MIKQRLEPNYRREQVAAALRDRIEAGEWAPGALMPSVREIAAEYECSPTDAHAALRILRESGLVIVRPRRGATVAWPLQSVSGPYERLERSRRGATLFRASETAEMMRVCLVSEPPPDALEAFGLGEDAQLGLREYLVRDAAGTVVNYGASYIHPDVWGQVPELREDAPIPDGIIGAVARVLGRQVGKIPPPRRKAGHATDEEASWLVVAPDSPVLVEVTECVAEDGGLIEWNMSVHPAGIWVGR